MSVTPIKESEPPKVGKSEFVRNSSIRLSDTRARRSIREKLRSEAEKSETHP